METVTLRVTSAFMLDGSIALRGALVEVPVPLAKDLLSRGKAELATEEQKEEPKRKRGK